MKPFSYLSLLALVLLTVVSCTSSEELNLASSTPQPTNTFKDDLLKYIEGSKEFNANIMTRSAGDACDSSDVAELIDRLTNEAESFVEDHSQELLENMPSNSYISEDSLLEVAADSTLLRQYIEEVYSPAFYEAYTSVCNGVSSGEIDAVLNDSTLSAVEQFVLAELCIVDDALGIDGNSQAKTKEQCGNEKMVLQGLCLLSYASDFAISIAMSEVPPAALVSLVASTATLVGCLVTTENNYKLCMKNSKP